MDSRRRKLSEVFEREGGNLYRLLVRLTLNEATAEELMQELFLRVWNSRQLSKVSNLKAYVRRAAINLAFDWRHKHKQKHVSIDDVKEPVSMYDSPLIDIIHKEHLDKILNVMSQLNETSREAFVMRYIEKKTYVYIGRQLDKTPHQARALCHKALNHVRYLLNYEPQSHKGGDK